jgi:hypothetical protein
VIAVKLVTFVGYAWCVAIVVGYIVVWMTSEHGGGVLSEGGFGEIWLIALTCLPGMALIGIGSRKK